MVGNFQNKRSRAGEVESAASPPTPPAAPKSRKSSFVGALRTSCPQSGRQDVQRYRTFHGPGLRNLWICSGTIWWIDFCVVGLDVYMYCVNCKIRFALFQKNMSHVPASREKRKIDYKTENDLAKEGGKWSGKEVRT